MNINFRKPLSVICLPQVLPTQPASAHKDGYICNLNSVPTPMALAKEIEKAYHEYECHPIQTYRIRKMASLGELSAEIAHQIQNPLIFVNNFSEVKP
jgi:hypothetical protein